MVDVVVLMLCYESGDMVVMVALSSLARILGECSIIHAPHVLLFFFKWRLARAH